MASFHNDAAAHRVSWGRGRTSIGRSLAAPPPRMEAGSSKRLVISVPVAEELSGEWVAGAVVIAIVLTKG